MNDARRSIPVAWVESPLQLLSAVEWAAASGSPLRVVPRATHRQMTATRGELLRRGLPVGVTIDPPTRLVPAGLLLDSEHWVLGDAFSGVVRAVLTAGFPDRVTLLDDGRMSLHLAQVLASSTPYSRPGHTESAVHTVLGSAARRVLLRLARRGDLAFFSAFPVADAAGDRVSAEGNAFEWLRSTAAGAAPRHPRVLLGSAAAVDGRIDEGEYEEWVRRHARPGTLFVPHRRENQERAAALAQETGMDLDRSDLPVELALSGHPGPVEIVSLPSSALTTLELVLADARRRFIVEEVAR